MVFSMSRPYGVLGPTACMYMQQASNFIYFCWYPMHALCFIILQGLNSDLTSSSVGGSASPSV